MQETVPVTVQNCAMDKTGRGVGVGDRWVKPGDQELGDVYNHRYSTHQYA